MVDICLRIKFLDRYQLTGCYLKIRATIGPIGMITHESVGSQHVGLLTNSRLLVSFPMLTSGGIAWFGIDVGITTMMMMIRGVWYRLDIHADS